MRHQDKVKSRVTYTIEISPKEIEHQKITGCHPQGECSKNVFIAKPNSFVSHFYIQPTVWDVVLTSGFKYPFFLANDT